MPDYDASGTSQEIFGIGEAGVTRLLLKNEGTGQLGLRNEADTLYTNLRVAQLISGDIVFDDTWCAECHGQFLPGDELVLRVRVVEPDPEKSGTLTRCVPIHSRCALHR